MKYERLTVANEAKFCRHKKQGVPDWKVIERLAELEDKIENGKYIELPCLKDVYMLSCVNVVRCKELIYLREGGVVQTDLYEETEFYQAERRLAELKGE